MSRIPVIPDEELMLHVYLSRRTLHQMFSPKKLKRYPLTVTVRDPKTGKDELRSLAERLEYYGPMAVVKGKGA